MQLIVVVKWKSCEIAELIGSNNFPLWHQCDKVLPMEWKVLDPQKNNKEKPPQYLGSSGAQSALLVVLSFYEANDLTSRTCCLKCFHIRSQLKFLHSVSGRAAAVWVSAAPGCTCCSARWRSLEPGGPGRRVAASTWNSSTMTHSLSLRAKQVSVCQIVSSRSAAFWASGHTGGNSGFVRKSSTLAGSLKELHFFFCVLSAASW